MEGAGAAESTFRAQVLSGRPLMQQTSLLALTPLPARETVTNQISNCRSVPTFGVSGPHWKKKSCFGPHIKYIVTCKHKKIS